MARVSLEQARSAKQQALRRFRKLENVTGVGITRVQGEYAVRLNLSGPVAAGVELPSEIEGVALRVAVTGAIRKR